MIRGSLSVSCPGLSRNDDLDSGPGSTQVHPGLRIRAMLLLLFRTRHILVDMHGLFRAIKGLEGHAASCSIECLIFRPDGMQACEIAEFHKEYDY
ncbi:MAG: hypothetical protein COZ11_00655 [Deltaproteobacteria bacterium CG_4_10_14_3_um_filter_51_14]|nr:MAG: hypothetical protein COZ11_00655 [Deltaproteobacteria bacterium CG_4_10_14_3_um_filter_51_14]PJB34349.1 MAG: hypothetical protein CO107_13525 [Deltaproteobacteria bacterium CG_4_9_14_3_um_filter_51_14]